MSKLLLSCDDYVYRYCGRFYAGRQDLIDFYQRYLRVFDNMRLVARCVEESELKPDRVPLDNEPRIEFIPVPEFHGPKEYLRVYFSMGKALENVVKGCDAAILRIPSTVALRVGNQVMKNGIPYACEVVFDAEDGWRATKGLSHYAWKVIDKQMRIMCRKADGVSCVTERYLQKHYYPLKATSFTSSYSSLALPMTFFSGVKSFPKRKPCVIAHIANQIEYNGRKGHKELIEAVKLLQQHGTDVRVRFAGKDYYGGEKKLKELSYNLGIADNVEFVGYLSREELDRFLDAADMYVMPTWAEGLPRVIIEAMAKGLPCITTPVSGNPELVDEHFLVEYNDIKKLADRIEELCTSAEIYEQTSLINYERSKKYEASILQARRDAFYSKLMDRVKEERCKHV